MCCISLHRFVGICFPVRSLSWVSTRRARLVSVAVWASVLFCQGPVLYFSRTRWFWVWLCCNFSPYRWLNLSSFMKVLTHLLHQKYHHQADHLLWHHQPRALWWLPPVQLCGVCAHVRAALHGVDGVLRPHGAEAPGAWLGAWRGGTDSPTDKAEISEDDHHRAGSVHALLPPIPPHTQSVLLSEIPEKGGSNTGKGWHPLFKQTLLVSLKAGCVKVWCVHQVSCSLLESSSVAYKVTRPLASANSCVDPILYFLAGQGTRSSFIRKSRPSSPKPTVSPDVTTRIWVKSSKCDSRRKSFTLAVCLEQQKAEI